MDRVLHMMNGLEVGGRERVVLQLLSQARRRLLDHRLVLFDTPFRDETLDFSPGDVPVYFQLRQPGLDLTLPIRIARLLRQTRAEVLHAHNDTAIFYGALAVLLAGVWRVALVGTFHTRPAGASWHGRMLTYLAGRIARQLTVVSRELGQMLTAQGWASKVTTIWNGIDLDEFAPTGPAGGWRKALGIPPNSFLVGHIGRFHPVKRQLDLVKAAGLIRGSNVSISLVLVGQGDMLPAVRREALYSDWVSFIPRVLEVPSFLRELDVFVLCSEHEAAPRVLLEAMGCGCAIVASSVGGIPEIMTLPGGELCGKLVPVRRPDLLAEAIIELASSVPLRKELGARARRRVADFSADKEWAEYARLYQSVLGIKDHRAVG